MNNYYCARVSLGCAQHVGCGVAIYRLARLHVSRRVLNGRGLHTKINGNSVRLSITGTYYSRRELKVTESQRQLNW